jgi:methylated-DNA-[protein]-cysteine S-methyltransferase
MTQTPLDRQTFRHARMASPAGVLTLVATDAGLAAILWEKERPGRVPIAIGDYEPADPLLSDVRTQLDEYFRGIRTNFSLPLDFHGTPFQRRVWDALLTIPYGETRSYAEIARQVGSPRGARAVGAANGRNPIAIIAPCHRVLGTSGALRGFAAGLPVKTQLLALEAQRKGTVTQRSLRPYVAGSNVSRSA